MPDSMKGGFQLTTLAWHWIKVQEVCSRKRHVSEVLKRFENESLIQNESLVQ